MKFLKIDIVLGVLLLTKVRYSKAPCPTDLGPFRPTSPSGNLVAYYGDGPKCEWKLSSDAGKKVVLNITFISCADDEFKINDIKFCQLPPGLYTFLLSSCRECSEDNCHKVSRDELKIKYDATRDSDLGFNLTYKFTSCDPTTPAPSTTTPAPSTTTPGPSTVASTVASPSIPTHYSTSVVPDTSLNSGGNSTTQKTTSSQATTTPAANTGASTMVIVFVPIVVILLLIVIVLLIIMKIRRKNLDIEKMSREQRSNTAGHSGPVTNAVGVSAYERIQNEAPPAGVAFGNQAYETVISGEPGGGTYAVIDDNTVYYSAVGGDMDQPGAVNATNPYESVESNGTQNVNHMRNNYDDVALDEDEDAGEVVENVLYGQTPQEANNYDEVTLDADASNENHDGEVVENVLYGQT